MDDENSKWLFLHGTPPALLLAITVPWWRQVRLL